MDEKSKQAPETWTARKRGATYEIYSNAVRGPICCVETGNINHVHLIVAAPDMCELLEKARELLPILVYTIQGIEEGQQLIEKIKACLEKIEE